MKEGNCSQYGLGKEDWGFVGSASGCWLGLCGLGDRGRVSAVDIRSWSDAGAGAAGMGGASWYIEASKLSSEVVSASRHVSRTSMAGALIATPPLTDPLVSSDRTLGASEMREYEEVLDATDKRRMQSTRSGWAI